MNGQVRPSEFVGHLAMVGDPRRVSQADILDGLRRVIVHGDARPGTPIPAEEVAAFYTVSPIPVRESLKTLIGEGLVEHRARGGYLVSGLTPVELHEVYLVRQALESAALRDAVSSATATDDRLVERTHADLGRSLADGDHRGYQRDSRRFHLALIAPSQMRRLIHMFEMAWNLTESAQPLADIDDEERLSLHRDHGSMAEAFVARDAERLTFLSQSHHRHLERAIGDPE